MPAKKPQNSKVDRYALRGHKVDYRIQNFFSFSSNGGFTLIELLVVLVVIGILATVVLANYNNFGKNQQVKNAAAELKSNLRKYQTLAISGQKNPDPTNPLCYDAADPTAHTMEFYFVVITVLPALSYDAQLRCDDGAT